MGGRGSLLPGTAGAGSPSAAGSAVIPYMYIYMLMKIFIFLFIYQDLSFAGLSASASSFGSFVHDFIGEQSHTHLLHQLLNFGI